MQGQHPSCLPSHTGMITILHLVWCGCDIPKSRVSTFNQNSDSNLVQLCNNAVQTDALRGSAKTYQLLNINDKKLKSDRHATTLIYLKGIS